MLLDGSDKVGILMCVLVSAISSEHQLYCRTVIGVQIEIDCIVCVHTIFGSIQYCPELNKSDHYRPLVYITSNLQVVSCTNYVISSMSLMAFRELLNR